MIDRSEAVCVMGAGSVGLTVGARLARAGVDVCFLVRSVEAAHEIACGGVAVEDPASGERFVAAARALRVEAAGAAARRAPVLLCTRSGDTDDAARALAAVAPDARVVSLQNDVDNPERLARVFPSVIAGVYRQTCTRTAPNAVRALGAGRIVLGDWPRGVSERASALGRALRDAGYDVGLSADVAEDLWLKLCVNLMSAPNALVRPDEHATAAFVEVKARLLEEARDSLAAAGIAARSCDGRDRSLADEIAFQRASLAAGTSARRLPVYNGVWTALRHGGAVEADRFHRRILALAKRYGVPAPVNARVLAHLLRAERERLGPECFGAAELLGGAG